MNKVITINLNGNAYQLEESGYAALREYLDSAARRLEGNPDKDEIIADIEQAIADKFRAVLGAYKTVVITREVENIIVEMGPVQDASTPSDDQASATPGQRVTGGQSGHNDPGVAGAKSESASSTKRLFRIHDGAMISGVCNGLAAYFNIDVTFVRLGFVVLFLTWGAGLLVYILMSFIVPAAETPAEKAAATGAAATAQEFIRRAKAGYYEGFKTFHDKEAHRAWKKKFKQDVRGWTQNMQREVQENAQQWQQNWHRQWAQDPRHPLGVIAWPFLSLLKLVVLLVMLFAILSLVADGRVCGVVLPSEIPLWVGVVFLVVVYHLLAWPLKALRHACYYPGPAYYGYRRPMAGLWDTLVWLGFFVLLIWLADHYVPQFHEALKNLPAVMHHAVDTVEQWWTKR